jgi:hypothetical protein
MDAVVAQAMAKWPNVPDVYGWLTLDRRGNWLIKGEKIANAALREFIARNYECDAAGCWYFQNGPQRVFVRLAYTPWVVRYEGEEWLDQCGRPFSAEQAYLDDEGSVLVAGAGRIALVDDRDLGRFADAPDTLKRITKAEIPARFGFVQDPVAG